MMILPSRSVLAKNLLIKLELRQKKTAKLRSRCKITTWSALPLIFAAYIIILHVVGS